MKKFLNLLPEKLSRRNAWRRLSRKWMVMAMILFTGFSLILTFQSMRLNSVRDELQMAKQQVAPVNYMSRQAGQLAKEIAALEQKEQSNDSGRPSLLSLLGAVVDATSFDPERLSVTRIGYRSANSEKMPMLSISGIAMNEIIVRKLESRLRQSELFRQVKLNRQSQRMIDGVPVQEYEIFCWR